MSARAEKPGGFLLPWLAGYQKDWLRPDVVAGLTAAAVVIPKAMAYATIAGLPVEVGLYTAFLPMLVYALARDARASLSVSTTTTLAILTGANARPGRPGRRSGGAAARLGHPDAPRRSDPGRGLGAAARLRRQLHLRAGPDRLQGRDRRRHRPRPDPEAPRLPHSRGARSSRICSRPSGHLPETSLPTLAVAVATIAILVGLERFLPRVPAPLVAVAAGIAGARCSD